MSDAEREFVTVALGLHEIVGVGVEVAVKEKDDDVVAGRDMVMVDVSVAELVLVVDDEFVNVTESVGVIDELAVADTVSVADTDFDQDRVFVRVCDVLDEMVLVPERVSDELHDMLCDAENVAETVDDSLSVALSDIEVVPLRVGKADIEVDNVNDGERLEQEDGVPDVEGVWDSEKVLLAVEEIFVEVVPVKLKLPVAVQEDDIEGVLIITRTASFAVYGTIRSP